MKTIDQITDFDFDVSASIPAQSNIATSGSGNTPTPAPETDLLKQIDAIQDFDFDVGAMSQQAIPKGTAQPEAEKGFWPQLGKAFLDAATFKPIDKTGIPTERMSRGDVAVAGVLRSAAAIGQVFDQMTGPPSPAMAEQMGMSHEEALKQYDLYKKGGGLGHQALKLADEYAPIEKQIPLLRERIASISSQNSDLGNAWQKGDLGMAIDLLGAQVMSNPDPEISKKVLQLKEEFEKQTGSTPLQDTGWVNKLLTQTVEMLPAMGKGAAIGVVPGVGPLAAGTMWAQQGAGATYLDLIKDGVDPETARNASAIVGPIYSAIETAQVGQLKKIPSINKAVKNGVKQAIVKGLKEYGTDLLKEVNEEGLQAVTQYVGKEIAKDKVKPGEMAYNAVKEYLTNAAASVGPMAIIGAPAKGIGVAKGAYNAVKAPKPQEAAVTPSSTSPETATGTGTTINAPEAATQKNKPQIPAATETVPAPSAVPVDKESINQKLKQFNTDADQFWQLPEADRNNIISQLPEEDQDNLYNLEDKSEAEPDIEEIRRRIQEVERDEEDKEEISNVNVVPTEGQKEAGNYRKAHIKRDGFDISIENPAGSERSGVDRSGKSWQQTINHDYGYIRGTVGKDKDHVDVFINPGSPEGGTVYVVNQIDPQSGKFDEHKCMVGFPSENEAREAYLSNYEKGWKGLGSIVPMPMEQFKEWVHSEGTKKPAETPKIYKDNLPGSRPVLQSVVKKTEKERPAAAKGLKFVLNKMGVSDVESFMKLDEDEQAQRFQSVDELSRSATSFAGTAADGILELNRLMDLYEQENKSSDKPVDNTPVKEAESHVGREVIFKGTPKKYKGSTVEKYYDGVITEISGDGKRVTVQVKAGDQTQTRIIRSEDITDIEGYDKPPEVFSPRKLPEVEGDQIGKEEPIIKTPSVKKVKKIPQNITGNNSEKNAPALAQSEEESKASLESRTASQPAGHKQPESDPVSKVQTALEEEFKARDEESEKKTGRVLPPEKQKERNAVTQKSALLQAKNIVDSIQNKSQEGLNKWLIRYDKPIAKKVFTEITGIALPENKADRIKVINAYTNTNNTAASEDQKSRSLDYSAAQPPAQDDVPAVQVSKQNKAPLEQKPHKKEQNTGKKETAIPEGTKVAGKTIEKTIDNKASRSYTEDKGDTENEQKSSKPELAKSEPAGEVRSRNRNTGNLQRGSAPRRPAAVKRNAPDSQYGIDYWRSEYLHHLNVELYNALYFGWRDRNQHIHTGRQPGWIDDYNILTDSNLPGGKQKKVLSGNVKEYLQNIVDGILENEDSQGALERLGLNVPEHIDDIRSWLEESLNSKGFKEYHKQYESSIGTEEKVTDKEYGAALAVFNKNPADLTPEQTAILESVWQMSIEDAIASNDDSAETISTISERKASSRKFEQGDLFNGGEFEDNRTEIQKEIERTVKDREEKRSANDKGLQGLPLFDKNEQEAMAAKQYSLFDTQEEQSKAEAVAIQQLSPEKQIALENDNTPFVSPTEETDKIEDFGEKIGGARKDTAIKTGRSADKKSTDDRPWWKKRFVAVKRLRDNKWLILDTKTDKNLYKSSSYDCWTFDTLEEADQAIPLAAVSQKHRVRQDKKGKYAIIRYTSSSNAVTVKGGFETEKDAMEYMVKNPIEILEKSTTIGEEILVKPEKVYRVGPERRKDDVKPKEFTEIFGFRGVEFGNWNNQEERQAVMNHAYDGLLDLAEILNIPPKAISLNGELALAFGARGFGLTGARAHYERDYGVINLTKMSGAGSLAHEWFHALDHYFGRVDTKASSAKISNERGDLVYKAGGRGDDYVSHGFSYSSKVRPEVKDAFKKFISAMIEKEEEFVEDKQKVEGFVENAKEYLKDKINSIRRDLEKDYTSYGKGRGNRKATDEELAQFDALTEKILSGNDLEVKPTTNERSRSPYGNFYYTNDTLNKMSKIYKSVRNRSGRNSERTGIFDEVAAKMVTLSDRMKIKQDADSGVKKVRKAKTKFYVSSHEIDRTHRASEYWGTLHEMAARAFSAYVEDKVKENGWESVFLSYGSNNSAYRIYDIYPFPENEERSVINNTLDQFFKTLKYKQKGDNVALYAKRDTLFNESSSEIENKNYGSETEEMLNNIIFAGEGKKPVPGIIKINENGPSDIKDIIKKITGKDVVFLDIDAAALDKELGFSIDGFTFQGEVFPELSNKIFIDLQSQRPILWTAFHEFAHHLEKNPEYNKKFWEAVRLTDEGTAKLARDGHSEFAADIIGEMMSREDFWQNLYKEDEVTFKNLIRKFIEILSRIINEIKRAVIGENRPLYERFIRDTTAVRNELASIIVDYNRSKEAVDISEVAPKVVMAIKNEESEQEYKEDIVKFQKTVDDFIAGKLVKPTFLVLKKTPKKLLMAGAKNHHIIMTNKILSKVVEGKYDRDGLPAHIVKQIPKGLINPIAVFKSDTQENSIVVVTDLVDQNNNKIIVAVYLNNDSRFNAVKSIYGKEREEWFAEQIGKGNLLYEDKKRMPSLLHTDGLQLPQVTERKASVSNISKTDPDVNADIKYAKNESSQKNKHIEEMTVDELEKYIEKKYEQNAPQDELDLLEKEWEKRADVEDYTEESYNGGDTDVLNYTDTYYAIAPEEDLIKTYAETVDLPMEERMERLRGAVREYSFANVTDDEILDAAKDAYENWHNIVNRKREMKGQGIQKRLYKGKPLFAKKEIGFGGTGKSTKTLKSAYQKSVLIDDPTIRAEAEAELDETKQRAAKLEWEFNKLKKKLSNISKDLLLERADITVKMKEFKMKSFDEIRSAIYNYAKKIGLRGVPYNKVDTLLKNTKTPKGLEKAIEIIDETWNRQARREAVESLFALVDKEYRRLKKIEAGKLKSTTSREANVRLKEYLDSLSSNPPDFEGDFVDWVSKMVNYYNNYAKKDIQNTEAVTDLPKDIRDWMEDPSKPVPDMISRAIRVMFSNKISLMNTDQVKKVIADIEQIKATGRTAKEEKEKLKKEELDQVAEVVAKDISLATRKSTLDPFEKAAEKHRLSKFEYIGKLVNKGFWGLIDPERMTEWLTGFKNFSTLKNNLLEPIYDAERAKIRNTDKALDRFRDIHKSIDMSKAMGIGTTIEYGHTDDKGNVLKRVKRSITYDQMMFIYANSKNPGNKAHLQGMFPSNNVADAVIAQITSELPENMRDAVDTMIKYFDEEQYSRMNDVFLREHDVELPKENNYFPIQNVKTDRAESAVVADFLARFSSRYAGVQKGMTKVRVHSKAPFRQMSYFGTVAHNLIQSEHYIAYNDAIRDTQRFLNHPAIKEAIQTKSEQVFTELSGWLKAVAYGKVGGSEHFFDQMSDFLRKNYSTFVLGLKLTTALLQFSSLPKGIAMINKKVALQSIIAFFNSPVKCIQHADTLSAFMHERASSYERELAEFAEKQQVAKFTGVKNASAKFKDFIMWHIGAIDKGVASILWNAKFEEEMAIHGNKEEAIKKADEVIRKTQSRGGVVMMPSIYRGPGMARAFTMFTSDLNQNINILFEMAGKWNMKTTPDKMSEVFWYFLLPSIMVYLVNSAVDWDDPEEMVKTGISQFSGGLPFLGQLLDSGIAMAADNVKEARGIIPDKAWRNYVMDLVPTSFQFLVDLGEGIANENPWQILEAGAAATGIPYSAGKRFKKGFDEIRSGGDWRALFWSESALKEDNVFNSMARRLLKPRPKHNDRAEYAAWYRKLSDSKKQKFREYLKKYSNKLNSEKISRMREKIGEMR